MQCRFLKIRVSRAVCHRGGVHQVQQKQPQGKQNLHLFRLRGRCGNQSQQICGNSGALVLSASLRKASGRENKKYEDKTAYCEMLERIQGCLKIPLQAGVRPRVYAYPFGAYCAESEQVIKRLGYEMSLTCNEGINCVKIPKISFF